MEQTRPFVFLNMAQSLDGKTTTIEKLKVRIGSPEDRNLMEELRLKADAVLIGKGTLLADDPPLLIRNQQHRQERKLHRKNIHPINIAVSSDLNIPIEDSDFFNCRETEKIVITTEAAGDRAISRLKKLADVYTVGQDTDHRVDLTETLGLLKRLGINQLLLEGGGTLNFAMLEQHLIDEMYLTLCPFIMGGPAPTTFDGRGFTKEQVRKLELVSVRQGGLNELFLHYRMLPEIAAVRKSRTFHKGYNLS